MATLNNTTYHTCQAKNVWNSVWKSLGHFPNYWGTQVVGCSSCGGAQNIQVLKLYRAQVREVLIGVVSGAQLSVHPFDKLFFAVRRRYIRHTEEIVNTCICFLVTFSLGVRTLSKHISKMISNRWKSLSINVRNSKYYVFTNIPNVASHIVIYQMCVCVCCLQKWITAFFTCIALSDQSLRLAGRVSSVALVQSVYWVIMAEKISRKRTSDT